MGPVLSAVRDRMAERWLAGTSPLPILDEASVALAREAARAAGAEAGLDRVARERLALVASELAHNQRRHATLGQIGVRAVQRKGVAGVEVVAADRGDGLRDPTGAFTGATPSPTGLGVGLSGVLRQADELDADVRWGEGTCLRARVFATPVAKSEVAILGRAHPAEQVSGDDAIFVRSDTGILLAVLDGLGHGPAARDAAMRGVDVVQGAADRSLTDLLARCEADLVGSRGAVMALAHVDLLRHELTHSALGNITTRIHGVDGTLRPLVSMAGTVGVTRPQKRIVADVVAFAPPQLVTMVSDGIVSRIDLSGRAALVRQHPLVIAQHVVATFARENDDAIVLVVR